MTDQNEKETFLPEVTEVKTREVSLMGGIIPKDFSELTRFASLVHQSRLAPKGFDTVEKVAIGLLTNMELGRPIITGLQDLAIINGRCGIYGDASLAMVTASGKMDEGYPISTETGTPYTDDWTFTFTVKRIGRPEEVGVWAWIDAKRAGFDDPKTKDGRKDIWSPWTRFTRRMMQWKARNFVMRDNFGDILKGMKTVEDLHDLDPVPMTKQPDGSFSTTPETETASDLADKIKEKAEKMDQKEDVKEDEAGKADEAVDAEFVGQDPADKKEPPPDDEKQGDKTEEAATEDLKAAMKKQDDLMTHGITPALAKTFGELTNSSDAGIFWRMREKGLDMFFDSFEGVMNTWPKEIQDFVLAKCKNISSKHPEFMERLRKAIEPKQETVAQEGDDTEDWNGLKQCPRMNDMNIPKIRCKDCEERSECPAWGGGMEQF